MTQQVLRKICALGRVAELAQRHTAAGSRVVLCHGCFDIVHPGHLRYLQFARSQGDVLVVSITGDDAIEKNDGMRPYVPQELRAENLAALEFVDHVVVVDDPTAEPIIRSLKPDVYIKGKEYEDSTHPGFLAEKTLVEQLGGRVIYSSGDVVFSSSAILENLGDTLRATGFDDKARLGALCSRWGIDRASLRQTLAGFRGKRVAIVGDALIDQYIFCDASNVSGEAPILTVRPHDEVNYLGGSAIIAAHLKAMGAQPHLFTAVGRDSATDELLGRLDDAGITHHTFASRKRLPVKMRYLADTQKLLKVDHADTQPLDSDVERQLLGQLGDLKHQLDAVILVDFGCGTLTHNVLTSAMQLLRPHVSTITGDISGARRTLLAFREADLLTPNERELRSVVGDFEGSLPTVAMGLMKDLNLANLAVTMGPRGVVMFRPREDRKADWFRTRLRSEYLPTLATHAVDPLGAGDTLLATATLAMTTGSTLQQAMYLGSAAASLAVSRIGNTAVSADDLQQVLMTRPELRISGQALAG
jgi:rfaE bifunctional protein kinase chain/domain/rfaE bifunctional protein nucleotidyltransferase chain/domain